jgi:glyceraldehyde 3-phosphate dehydrogenase
MAVRIAINGFGRIGRLVTRIATARGGFEIVGVNDLVPADNLAYLLKYDTSHGRFDAEVKADGDAIVVNGKRIACSAVKDPAQLPWKAQGVDYVLEATGLFTAAEDARKHLDAGAKRVLISAPTKSEKEVPTFVHGVNCSKYDPAVHTVLSNASCTTNCLAPIVKVLLDHCGIDEGLMTTVHAYTNDQKILDQIHDDPRRARAAALSMIPTTTGAARAVGEVLPQLKGKLDGSAIRVPTPNVSVVDLTFESGRATTKDEVNAALQAAADGELKGVLDFVVEPLVSIDFNHSPASSTVDSLETAVIGGNLVRVLSWYDNEWGFSNRMADTAVAMGKFL